MRPTAARSNRSSIHHPRSSPIPTPSTTSSVCHQQQQIVYAPISNPMVTLQPCGTALHPSCVYPSLQSHVDSPNSASLHPQGKNNRWHSKNKPSRGQQYYQQQQQLSYNPKPVVLLDQSSSSIAPTPPSTTSFLVASSTFAHAGPLPSEHYNTSGVTHLLPQPFNLKPPDMQAFCLIQDRQNAQQQHQQHPMQASYYNISATNTCSLQTVNANSSFPLPNLNPYANLTTFSNSQFPTSSPIFSNPPVGLVLAPPRVDKPLSLPTLEFSSFNHNASNVPSVCESRIVPISHNNNSNDWISSQIETSSKDLYDVQTAGNNNNLESTDCALQEPITAVAKAEEEHCSDESSISFDFTIEAEKMVSALCNTTSSNDLGKEELKHGNKTDSTPLFSGAGDNGYNKRSWFADFCSEYENGISIGVQTDSPCVDRSQYPELIRKTAYWGCSEAEIVLGSDGSQTDSKRSWLTCLSSATKTAITKSSTCIPVFAGDRIFANDLINALLRISNGWLSLDNYLNKQHFPNLLDRLDPELITCFHTWEESTYELLKEIVRTFQKFGENNEVMDQKRNATCGSSSFPGDVLLYTNYDLFTPLSSSFLPQRNTIGKFSSQENLHSATSTSQLTSSLHNVQYNTGQQEQQSANQKESKLRSKWTITENLSPVINTAKSVPNVSACHTDVSTLASSKLRTKDTSSSRKCSSTQKSLNAEFCQLRNKVMESSTDAAKDRKHNYMSENKLSPSSLDNPESIRLQHPGMNNNINYSGLYAQNCLSFTFPLSNHSDASHSTPNPGILTYRGPTCSSLGYPIVDINPKSGKNSERIYGTKSVNANPVYVGRCQTDQIELPAVPRNKVTLLSQIEPRTLDKESEEMAANLSAWFASMRNAQLPATVPTFEETRMNENTVQRLFVQQEIPKYSMGMSKQSQIDTNRQFQALQNLPNIQSTPWAAGNFVDNRFQVQQVPEEYDSSEDVRVYMKPGSYNVPKKRHQKRANRRSDSNATSRSVHTNNHSVCGNKGKSISIPASSTPLSHTNVPTLSNISNATLIKTSFPPASQLPTPLFNLENSPRILKRTESLSQDVHQDVTWKAACASAEILLEALNIKDYGYTLKKVDCDDTIEKDKKNEENAEVLPTTLQQNDLKSMKRECDVDCASSYEASEDDSGSTCRLSPSTSVTLVSQSHENENALSMKTNVKTDSWLIRTLNNASIVSKQKRRKDDVDRRSLESSNSSEIADIKPDQFALPSTANADTKIIVDSEYPAIFSRERISRSLKNDEMPAKELENHVGRATYSETVRRSMKSNNVHLERKEPYKSGVTNSSMITAVPIPGRKSQKKDPEQSYQLLHKSRRSADKKAVKNMNSNDLQLEEGSCAKVSGIKSNNVMPKSSSITKTYGKKKDLEHLEGKYGSKSGDRGWSVWYSSRRKQSLSPLALSKLETIHQTVLQMDEAKIFKYSLSCNNKDGQSSSAGIMEDYSKIVKSPMFLDVEYKLKNRIYHKVEHVVKDFRRIIHNARLYHQHDNERTKKIEVLSNKLEDLFEEHFGNWDFDNITDSPREDLPMQLRFKTSGQKSIAGRCDNTKKGASLLTIAENSSLH